MSYPGLHSRGKRGAAFDRHRVIQGIFITREDPVVKELTFQESPPAHRSEPLAVGAVPLKNALLPEPYPVESQGSNRNGIQSDSESESENRKETVHSAPRKKTKTGPVASEILGDRNRNNNVFEPKTGKGPVGNEFVRWRLLEKIAAKRMAGGGRETKGRHACCRPRPRRIDRAD